MNGGTLKLEFYGGLAARHELDLYDAGRSIEGLGSGPIELRRAI